MLGPRSRGTRLAAVLPPPLTMAEATKKSSIPRGGSINLVPYRSCRRRSRLRPRRSRRFYWFVVSVLRFLPGSVKCNNDLFFAF